ncbi:MAG TPA: helical backbone metal receptor [Egibacteraceae bacterium]
MTRRIVSLVPSVTQTLAALGAADLVVGVTDYCRDGAPPAAARVGGTKNPDLDAVAALHPDVVVANTEENRPEDLDALRAAGVTVHETYPRTVADVEPLLRDLAAVAGDPVAAEPLVADLAVAREEAARRVPQPRVVAVTLVWRRPWRAVGPDTYVDDLLWQCGFANALAGWDDRYPRLEPGLLLGADVVLLPSEPYAFGPDDRDAVADLVGDDVAQRFVDGALLTWHGARTAEALRTFSALAAELVASAG